MRWFGIALWFTILLTNIFRLGGAVLDGGDGWLLLICQVGVGFSAGFLAHHIAEAVREERARP